MKKILFVMSVLAVSALFVSCSTTNYNNLGTSVNPITVVNAEEYITETELLNEGKPVSATVTGKDILVFTLGLPATFAQRGDLDALPVGGYSNYKQAATYAACEAANCDSLLDAKYVITEYGFAPFYKEITCTVTGVPVKITGYKKLPYQPIVPANKRK